MKRLYFTLFLFYLPGAVGFAQEDSILVENLPEKITETFHSTRIINGHSIETLGKGVLEFRVEHRFGDMAGADGGVQNMFGLDNSSDIRLALEYGLTDRMMIGLGRSKGTGRPYRSLIDGFYKIRAVDQTKGGFPISVAMLGTTTYSYMKASEDIFQVAHFPEWEHRLAYSVQVNFARKFHERFSAALMPTMVHYNLVPKASDPNDILALGIGGRQRITKMVSVNAEYYYLLPGSRFEGTTNSFSIGFDIETAGHVFQLTFT